MGRTGRIAMRVVLAIGPGRVELAAGARPLFIHRAAHPATDVAHKPNTTCRLGLGPQHRDMERADLDGGGIRHRTAGRGAFAPEERHTKVRAAGAAREAGIVDRHGRMNTEKPAKGRHRAAILFIAANLGRAPTAPSQKIFRQADRRFTAAVTGVE